MHLTNFGVLSTFLAFSPANRTGFALRSGPHSRLWKPGEQRPEGVPQVAPGPMLSLYPWLRHLKRSFDRVAVERPGGFRRRPQQLDDSVSPDEGLQGRMHNLACKPTASGSKERYVPARSCRSSRF